MIAPSYLDQAAAPAPAPRRAGVAVLAPVAPLFRQSVLPAGFTEIEATTANPATPRAQAAKAVAPATPSASFAAVDNGPAVTRPRAAGPPVVPDAVQPATPLANRQSLTPPAPRPAADVGTQAAAPPIGTRPSQPPPAVPERMTQTRIERETIRTIEPGRAAPPSPSTPEPSRVEPPRPELREAAPPPPVAPTASQPPLLMPAPAPVRAEPRAAIEPPTPGLHIGTIEVRVTMPPPVPIVAPPSPRMQARAAARGATARTRIARGFGHFGLAQS